MKTALIIYIGKNTANLSTLRLFMFSILIGWLDFPSATSYLLKYGVVKVYFQE